MWLVRLVAVAAALCLRVGAASLILPDTPDYQKCTNRLFDQLNNRLDTLMGTLDGKLMDVHLRVQEVCAPSPTLTPILTPPAAQTAQGVSETNLMLTMLTKMEAMEQTLTQMQRTLNAAPTREDLSQTRESTVSVVEAAVAEIKSQVAGSLKEEDAKRLINASMEVVVQAIQKKMERCATEEGVAELVGDAAAAAAAVTENTLKDLNCMEKTARVEEMVAELLNFTRQPPPPTLPPTTSTSTSTTTPPPPPTGPVYPCEDSTFPNTGYKPCEAALRFNKCHLLTVAYHCCHTCTTHNKLPLTGPWRFLNLPRSVNTLEVLRFFTL